MVGMMVRIDNVPHRHQQVIFEKVLDLRCFLGDEGVYQNCPLGANYRARGYLRIEFTLKPINIFGDSFPLHRKILLVPKLEP
jgi:hypothetical protein